VESGPRGGPGPPVRALGRASTRRSPEYLEPLVAVLDRLKGSPGRILDIGIRVAIGQLEGGARPGAEVVGIDISAEMVAQAKAKAAEWSGPVLGRRHGAGVAVACITLASLFASFGWVTLAAMLSGETPAGQATTMVLAVSVYSLGGRSAMRRVACCSLGADTRCLA
jgi:SAM-dependent methyltransferase